MAQQRDARPGARYGTQVCDERAQVRGGLLGPAGRGDRGADGAGRLVAQPGHHRGARARRGLPGEPLVQRGGGRVEPAVGVEARVGAGDQDGDAVGAGEVAQDLRHPAGAAAVEAQQLPGRGSQVPVRRRPVTVVVGFGHTGGLGGVGAVGRVRLAERRRVGTGEGGGRRCGDLRASRRGQREDHRDGDQDGERGPPPAAGAAPSPPATAVLQCEPHGRPSPAHPAVGAA